MNKGWSGFVVVGPPALVRGGSRVLRATRAGGRAAVVGLFALLLSHQAHGQEIWRHTDDQGRTRYADRPFPGAVRMDPPAAPQWLGTRARASERTPSGKLAAQDEKPTPASASAAAPAEALPGSARVAHQPRLASAAAPVLEIASPAPGETVWGTGGELKIRLAIDGDTKDGARLSILLDGAEATWRGEPPTLRLAEVWRGEHRLQARLLDRAGKPLAASKEIRFFKREPTMPLR